MIQCQHCGQNNAGGSNFCRFCGNKFQQTQHNKNEGLQQMSPRKPYSWQTDEFQLKDQPVRPTEQIDRVHPITNQLRNTIQQGGDSPQNRHQQMLQPQNQNTLSSGYHCPFCNTNAMPIVVKKVSPAGWAVFTALLITTIVLFWIGLLIQEERRICPVCNMRVG